MEVGRFSLLLLEPGEIYFEDFSAALIPIDTTPKTYETKKQCGRLKLCSKSLVFDPKDLNYPLIKLPLRDCDILEQWKGSAKFLKNNYNVLSVHCSQYIEMLEKNFVAPYKFVEEGKFLFLLNYAHVSDCLPRITQLQRASTLPAAEHADMIATIVHSRQARVSFDHMWLDLYEMTIMETQADKVTPLVVNPGRILLSNIRLYFQPYNNVETYPVLKMSLSSIKSIIKRRFLLRQIGLEIYSDENEVPHLYLSFRSQKDRDSLYDTLLNQPELKLQTVEQDVMTLQWQNGIISNYDYLIYVNSQADRTVNDLTQYPVFPWIISDYQSSDLNLNNPQLYRDLSKPVGALSELRLKRLLERYDEMSHPKFLYGSHYSTPGFVLFYLVRLYPHYMLCLQNGRFDHPDRMFNSVADVYRNCLNNLSDFKELVPEFYDVEKGGKFLVNELGIHFGYRHNGIKVGDVELPPWASGPEDFVRKLRDALESDHVSKKLHNWIDLIFGYKQRGEEAVAAKNLFYHLCYEGNVNLEAITDLNQKHALEVQIMEFGQIPKQIFKVPHPKRKTGLQMLRFLSIETNSTEELEILESWKKLASLDSKSSFKTHRGSITCTLFSEDSDKVISVGMDSKMKMFSISLNRQIRSANIGTMPLSSCLKLPNVNALVIGSYDNNIVIYDLDFGKITQNVIAHEDAILCLAWGNKAELLASGSGDCTVRLWKGISTETNIKPVQCLITQLDHASQVTTVTFDPSNTFLASGTEDGEIYMWCINNFSLFKKNNFHNAPIRAVKYSLDGQKIASCGDDGLFQIIDINTGMALFHRIFQQSLHCLQWSDFLLVLGSNDGFLHIWDTNDVVCLGSFQAHEGTVKSVDISPDKKSIVTGGEDYQVKIWQPL